MKSSRHPAKPPAHHKVGVGKAGLVTSTQKLLERDNADRIGAAPFAIATADLGVPLQFPEDGSELDFSLKPVTSKDVPSTPKQVKKSRATSPISHPKREFLTGASPFAFKLLRTKPKATVQKPKLKATNARLLAMSRASKKPFLDRMNGNQEALIRFLVRAIAPKMLPAVSAIDDTRDVIKEIMGVDIGISPVYSTLLRYLKVGAEVKMLSWVAKYLDLSPEETRRLIAKMETSTHEKELPRLSSLHQLQRQQEKLISLLQEMGPAQEKPQSRRGG